VKNTSFRLSEEAAAMLQKLASEDDRSQTKTLERLIREAFRKRGLKLE
jgi:predicted transcriptional regulator